jgi:23S rRNA pseudouridine1911/1915/1917 synthase
MIIKILYEDKNLMVIDKPSGISVHGDGKTKEKTVSDWVLENYPTLKNVGEPISLNINGKEEKILRPGIVHRIDRETSGVLIIAKNKKTFEFLKEQFQNHKIKKIYRAFVYGNVASPKASLLTNKRGVINVPIGRSPLDVRMWTAGRGAREPVKEAVTEYVVLDRFVDESIEDSNKNKFSYIEVYPKTGRTHQIRVHMRYINHPIVSDPLYRGNREKSLGMKRLALHAYSVSFIMPNSEIKEIVSDLPNDFKKVIKNFSSPTSVIFEKSKK